MNRGPTDPPILSAQNSQRSLRLLAAQRRLYSDAKVIHFARISTVLGAGIAISSLSLAFNSLRPLIGTASGLLLFLFSVVGSAREKRKQREAAAVQEEFDTSLYRLEWNNEIAARPNNSLVARAAARHRGGGLENWYGDTGSVVRPLDVLICQRSNLGWSISLHAYWAAGAVWCGVFTISSTVMACGLTGMSFNSALLGVFSPLVPVVRELIEIWRLNSESLRLKEEADARGAQLWDTAMKSGIIPSEAECRKLQDVIFSSRQKNALIPDWFYQWRRNAEEDAMRLGVEDYVLQAAEVGMA
ncbi:S-4TM family putative pore-forming effector [Streptomyces sp. NBC_01262]